MIFNFSRKVPAFTSTGAVILCLYVGDGDKDDLGLIITLLKLYAAED